MLDAYALPSYRNQRAIALRSMLPLVSPDSVRTWVNFTIDGTYEGHHAGSFTFDKSVNAELIANFNAQKNPIPLTYEHPRYDDGMPKPAAGWCHELEIRGNGLWGLCEFTDTSAKMVRAGEYKFTSVVVLFDATDRKTNKPIGAQLIEVALTNRPYIDGQKPISLTRRSLSMNDIDIKAALKALGLDDSAGAEQAAAVLAHAMAAAAAQDGDLGKEEPKEEKAEAAAASLSVVEAPAVAVDAAAPEGEAQEAAAQSALAKLMEITGKDEAGAIAFLEENAEAIRKIAGAQPESGTQADDFEDKDSPMRYSLLEGTLKALTARLDKYESEATARETQIKAEATALRANEAKAKVALAVERGRIPEADAGKWISLATSSPADFDQVISTIVPHVPTEMIATRSFSEPASFSVEDTAELKRYEDALRHVEPDAKKRKEIALKDIKRRRSAGVNGRA